MPDTNDQTITNPQSLVDAALGSTPPVPTPPAAEPVIEPVVETVVAPAPPVPTVVAPEPSVTMGDETPLAFVSGEPASAQPPVELTPPAATAPIEQPKKKSKMGIVVGGILLLVLALGGGTYGFVKLTGYPANVSVVNDCAGGGDDCDSKTGSGGSGSGKVGDSSGSSTGGDADVDKDAKKNKDKDTLSEDAIYRITQYMVDNRPDGVSPAAVTGSGYIDHLRNNYDLNTLISIRGQIVKCPKPTAKSTDPNCNWKNRVIDYNTWVNRNGFTKAMCKTYWNNAKTGNYSSDNPCDANGCKLTKEMAEAGCEIQQVDCKAGGQLGVACNENITKKVTKANEPVLLKKDEATCGSRQIDIICSSFCGTTKPISFASYITGKSCVTNKPPQEPPTVEKPNPTLVCKDLTHTPAGTPKVGDNLLFSCEGASKPAGAVKLTYNYRYQLNGGAWKTMATDKSTNPRGKLAVDACGTYKVQCRVCGTIAGKQVCNPIWSGATQ